MTILQIESYKGDISLYGKSIAESKLKWQIKQIEKIYDRDTDNFIELFCRRFDWTVFETEDVPDFVYDRDTGLILGKSDD